MLARLAFLLSLLAISTIAAAEVPNGIPQALAQQRAARVSDLHYVLHYTLVPQARNTHATESLRFRLEDADAPLLLDFRDGQLDSLRINGKAIPAPKIEHGHIVLEQAWLRAGENTVEAGFAASIAPAQKAITRYQDHDDASEYIYTLFVPMDASMAFPCFDQPDLKATYQLTLTAPAAWTVISNTAPASTQLLASGQKQTRFGETRPISSYLFAFAAGPFVRVHDVPGLPGLYVRKSKAREAAAQAPQVQQTAADGMRYLADYFAQPFPFPKYDMVLIPGFAFGGMEHAGATFLREESVLFRSAPTTLDMRSRDILVLHELAHQWFGDFTTMRWFDDLWLKEGFAQYMAFQTLAALHPHDGVWRYFHSSIKPSAYAIDETLGTTPIYQDIPNLADAKSAYGSIVYSKAPGVLKQLAYVLGDQAFRDGLRLYLAKHAYGNAEWSDLIGAFETVSGKSLHGWADSWIRHRGMPQVDVQWSCAGDKLARFELSQHDVLGTDTLWPVATDILLAYPDGSSRTLRADLATRHAEVAAAVGTACPAYVFANNDDHAYGLFLLDGKSRNYVMSHPDVADPFRRMLLWDSLWQAVRTATLAPERYVQLALRELPHERDPLLVRDLLGNGEVVIHNYLGEHSHQQYAAGLQQLAAQRMLADPDKDLRIDWFRALPGVSEQAAGRSLLHELLLGKASIPGVALRQQDRWRLVAALIAYADPQAGEALQAEQQRDPSDFGKEYAYIVKAATPDAETKRWYFDDYLHNRERPEDWVSGSLGTFNYWNQSALTAPYLQPALGQLEQIKHDREIFFLLGWLNAFIGGQHSLQAQQQVHDYLAHATLDSDLRLKILEIVDRLDRAVAIRQRFPTN